MIGNIFKDFAFYFFFGHNLSYKKVCIVVFEYCINGLTFLSRWEGEPEDESLVKTRLSNILKNILQI